MRKVTNESTYCFLNATRFDQGNTKVIVHPNVTVLTLFGYEIAYLYNDPEKTLSITNCGYFTNTTKEHLNGLPNVQIQQKQGFWFLNGKEWDGKLIDIK